MPIDDIVAGIMPVDATSMEAARQRQQRLTKPPGSLGRLEELSVQAAGVLGSGRPAIRRKALIIAAADHGVVAEGVSGYPQEVTAQMVMNFLAGGAAINVMARRVGVELTIVDAGVATPLAAQPELQVVAIGRGTKNMVRGPVMTREQAERCIRAGVVLAREAAAAGADLIGTGDMGIGNTTAAAAITATITRTPTRDVTGRGTGRDDEQLKRKVEVVEQAIATNRPNANDGLDVLARVGGFEIGVLAGVILGAAQAGRIVVLDGFISGAAALIAHSICPTVRDYLIAAHLSSESGHRAVLTHLALRPLLDLGMRLGEGTGAVLAMGLVESAVACLSEMATFDEAGVSDSDDVR